jgi:hypothetical protein
VCRHAGCPVKCMPCGPQLVPKKLIISSHPLPLSQSPSRGPWIAWFSSGCVAVVGRVPVPRPVHVSEQGEGLRVRSCEDGEPVDCGVSTLELPLGPVGWCRQLVQLGVQGCPEFSKLGFRQGYSVDVQFAAADGHMFDLLCSSRASLRAAPIRLVAARAPSMGPAKVPAISQPVLSMHGTYRR